MRSGYREDEKGYEPMQPFVRPMHLQPSGVSWVAQMYANSSPCALCVCLL